ncbi:MAG: DUF177 domain-containing protein [Calditrichaeota bacterium]|nr:MAG: DUF177 domain-containing protein [Calditrichota bacterium]
MKIQVSHLTDGLHSDHLLDSASAFGFENPDDFAGKIKVDITIDKRRSDFYLKFAVMAKVFLVCDRCLERFESLFEDEARALYTTNEKLVTDDSGSTYLIQEGQRELEVGTEVREIVVLALPIKTVCSENCKGLCKCGRNLNKEACTCEEPDIDPRWETLKKLKNTN